MSTQTNQINFARKQTSTVRAGMRARISHCVWYASSVEPGSIQMVHWLFDLLSNSIFYLTAICVSAPLLVDRRLALCSQRAGPRGASARVYYTLYRSDCTYARPCVMPFVKAWKSNILPCALEQSLSANCGRTKKFGQEMSLIRNLACVCVGVCGASFRICTRQSSSNENGKTLR